MRIMSFFCILFLLMAGSVNANVESVAKQLILRMVPSAANQFTVESIPPAENNADVFEVDAGGGKVILRGNNGVAIASALNYYLENYPRAHVSWDCGNQLNLPAHLPRPTEKIRVVSPMRYRYVFNYCTHGYTMAWWDWDRWEREIDVLAMKGVNLALVIQGQEQVWIDALKTLGYTDLDVRSWLCMPSHQPWQYMSNMENKNEPIPSYLVKSRLALGKKILTRMRSLGIQPVQQGYYGIVPSDFKKRFPNAKVHGQGRWAGGKLKRPYMLDPTDPLFVKLAHAFYVAQKNLYGKTTFFAADPFHEGGSTKGINLANAGRVIYDAMARANPDSVWVLQSWGGNPKQGMINALPKNHLLVLDLYCERKENWRKRKQFGHVPWLWCTIHNFGGNSGLTARLDRIASAPLKAYEEAGPGKGQMSGIGALLEGSGNIPILWEMFFKLSWSVEPVQMDAWIRDYARRRYGAVSESAVDALEILHRTAYAAPFFGRGDYPYNSAICGRPRMKRDMKARQYTSTTKPYPVHKLAPAWGKMIESADACGASDGYRFDLVDLGRQVLGDLGTRYHYAIFDAWKARDADAVRLYSKKQLELIKALDKLVGTREEFLVGKWIADARKWGGTPEEKDYCERSARALITTWTVPQSHVDYANRQWSGLLKDVYYERWNIWADELEKGIANNWKLNQGRVGNRIKKQDYDWVKNTSTTYSSMPVYDSIEVSREIWKRFSADAMNPSFYKPETQNAK